MISLIYYFTTSDPNEDGFPSLLFLYYLLFPLIMFWDTKNKEKQFIQVNPEKLIFKNNLWIKQHEIKIDNVKFIEINFTDIYMVTNDQKSFKLNIGGMLHSDMQELKSELKVFRMKAYDLSRSTKD